MRHTPIEKSCFAFVRAVHKLRHIEFDLKYVGRKIIKGSIMSDFCAKNPIEGEDGKEDFLDQDILDIELGAWKMYFDEAMN